MKKGVSGSVGFTANGQRVGGAVEFLNVLPGAKTTQVLGTFPMPEVRQLYNT